MANLFELRLAAREIFEAALRAVDPAAAIKNAVRLESSNLTICEKPFDSTDKAGVFAIATGKAAGKMAVALDDVLGDRLTHGVLAAPRTASSRWQYFEGGHPLPNEASLAAAKEAFALLDRANEVRAFVLFLITGGGSAMLEWPINDEITLEDLRSANQTLVNCGASISEINAVRRAFSAVKGGRLAARAPNCRQVTLIVSDVPAGEEHNVASGPTLSAPSDAPRAAEVVGRYGLRDKLPASIIRAIEASHSDIPRLNHPHSVLLDNDTALEAAANTALERGLATQFARDITDESIDVGCEKLLTRLREMRTSVSRTIGADVCLISGGEFSCPVRGDGLGGRNLETALRLTIAADQNRERFGEFVALCAGTDGIDGNSPAAGAIVDNITIQRAREIGLDAHEFLQRSDAFSFFDALGDAIITGPTGTNVRDVRILVVRTPTSRVSDRITSSLKLRE